jgi:pimeloyl-ACP methyl ester carboxylesterase
MLTRHSLHAVTAAVALLLFTPAPTALAQQPTPTPALDRRGLPLPFGVQPYYMPDVPLGTGPYKAIMSEEKGLTRQIVYYPKDLAKLGTKKLPIVLWANGSCLYAGNRYRQFLTEIASHGYLVVAGGPMGDKELEVGPQQNPAIRGGGPGAAAAQPQAPARGGAGAAATEGRGRGGAGAQGQTPARGGVDTGTAPVDGRVTAEIMKEGLDWAFARNADSSSPFSGKLDTQHVVMMGHSCGGAVAIDVATTDPRVAAVGVWASGFGLIGRGNDNAGVAQKIRGPVLVISGTEALDIAYGSAKNTFELLNNPVFYAWRDDMQHIGTFGAANGGELGRLAVNWLEWQTRGDQNAAKWFKGANCTLCKDPAWHVQKKKIDKTS